MGDVMTELTIHRRLMPQDIDDWKHLVMNQNPRPEPCCPVTDALRERVDAYNQRIGTIATRDTKAVAEAIRRAHFENDHSAYGSATCLILDGLPLSGKTHAALSAAFSETKGIWSALGRQPDDCKHHRSVPWIYVEVPKLARGFSLLKAIWTFLGPPPLPRTPRPPTTSQLCASSHPRLACAASSSTMATALARDRTRSRDCWPTSSKASSPAFPQRSF